jgi:hypothetical protein
MQKGRGGMGSTKHGKSGYAPRSPRYKFQKMIEANKEKPRTRPRLTASTVQEALTKR